MLAMYVSAEELNICYVATLHFLCDVMVQYTIEMLILVTDQLLVWSKSDADIQHLSSFCLLIAYQY